MKSSNITFYFLSHFLAICVNFSIVLGSFVVLTVLEYVFDPDPPGGPGFILPMLLVFCVPYAVFLCVVAFWITVALQILRSWKKYPRWIPEVLALPVVLTILVSLPFAGRIEPLVMSLILGLIILLDFCTYWLLLWGAESMINSVRKSFQVEDRTL
jgi:hypothetical protein